MTSVANFGQATADLNSEGIVIDYDAGWLTEILHYGDQLDQVSDTEVMLKLSHGKRFAGPYTPEVSHVTITQVKACDDLTAEDHAEIERLKKSALRSVQNINAILNLAHVG